MKFAALCAVPDAVAASRPGSELACLARLEAAEAQGYESVWLCDPASARLGHAPALHLIASALAARTTRIRIGTATALAPTLHPLRLAEEVALLDVMTGGRLDWAIGPASLSDESEEVFREQLDVLLFALAGERFAYDGRFFRIPELQCFPTPLQTPHPPLWLRAESIAVQQWAADAGHPLMTDAFATTESLTGGAGTARLVVRPVHVARTDAIARAEAGPALVALHRARGEASGEASAGEAGPLLEHCAIVGDAARCRDKLAELAEGIGLAALVAWHGFGTLPDEAALDSQRRLIDDVAPAFA
jgi:alkanesulfonate monooxygenase SsuD/methylene tetrahydromethanopterin reductase-like flavin-dependent oxidoreductase (luciferase family)